MYIFYSQKPEQDKQSKSKYHAPRITVVGEYSPDQNMLYLAVARSSKKDSFSRKKGRLIAGSRLKNKFFYKTISLAEFTVKKFVEIATNEANLLKQDPSLVKHHKRVVQS